MKIVQSLDELRNLNIGNPFWVVTKDQHHEYSFCGVNPKTNEVMGISTLNPSKVECFSAQMFLNKKTRCAMIGEWSSQEIGQVMIDQLTSSIESIKAIYLK